MLPPAGSAHPPGRQPDPRLVPAIAAGVLQTKDAYAARDILVHPVGASLISPSGHDALSGLLDASGLESGTMPPVFLDALTANTTTAEALLARALTDMTGRIQGGLALQPVGGVTGCRGGNPPTVPSA